MDEKYYDISLMELSNSCFEYLEFVKPIDLDGTDDESDASILKYHNENMDKLIDIIEKNIIAYPDAKNIEDHKRLAKDMRDLYPTFTDEEKLDYVMMILDVFQAALELHKDILGESNG